jgi:hypothetical protein
MLRSLPPIRMAYTVLAGPVLWFIHFVVVYSIAEFGCRANFNNLLFITPATMRIIIIAITIPVLVLVGIGGGLAYRRWIGIKDNSSQGFSTEERERFLIMVAMLLCALFLFSIVMTTMPTFFLDVCDQVV